MARTSNTEAQTIDSFTRAIVRSEMARVLVPIFAAFAGGAPVRRAHRANGTGKAKRKYTRRATARKAASKNSSST